MHCTGLANKSREYVRRIIILNMRSSKCFVHTPPVLAAEHHGNHGVFVDQCQPLYRL
jgi:hypothetical protein